MNKKAEAKAEAKEFAVETRLIASLLQILSLVSPKLGIDTPL